MPELLCFLSEYVISETSGRKFRFVKENMRETAGTEWLKWVLRFRMVFGDRSYSAEFLPTTGAAYLTLIPCFNPFRECPPSSSNFILTIVIYLPVSFHRLFWHQMLRHLMRPAAFEEHHLTVDSSRQRTLILDRSKEYRCGDDDVGSVVTPRDLEERIV